MRVKVFLALAAASAVVFFVWLFSLRHVPRDSAAAAVSKPSAVSPPLAAGPAASSGEKKSRGLPVAQSVLWAKRPTEPNFAAFADWAEGYAAATPDARKALEADGIKRAGERLTAMADMIVQNPERALELAVPPSVRETLPQSVKDLLETRINTRGDLEVLGVLPLPGREEQTPPIVRQAKFEGSDAQVFTFGSGLQYVTRHGVPLKGITIPTAFASKQPLNPVFPASLVMALDPNPAEVLDASEASKYKQALQSEPICDISKQPTDLYHDETYIRFGGEIHSFCGKVHAQDWIDAGIAASALDQPGADVPIAESPYTEGRKRMLLMRPIWSDYTGGMTTNDALTHFINFSNYMYEMSYGKLVLAALGQGSEITPPLLLPGLVAEYDNTGLGKLYNTCKDVARTNYGYTIGNYDFTYVTTGSRPAANYCGLAFVGGVGFHLPCWGDAVSCHEFGHNLGLNHAHFWDTDGKSAIGAGANVEYGDNNDPMGGGGSPNTYNSRYKNYLGWIPTTDIADLNVSGSGRYRLYSFDLDSSTVGLRGMKFRYSSSQNYWINFRQRKTSKKALMNGVQLLWTGNNNEGSYLLDVRTKGDADDNAIVIGRTFSDTNLGFHFTPVGKGNTYPESMDVVVNIGQFPANHAPIASVSASPLNPASGAPVLFSAGATDSDGDTLAYYWDFGDGDYSIDNKALTTHSFSSAGEYAVQCTVSDMKGGTARHSVIVRVGNPSTFRISGHVVDTKNKPMSGIRVTTDSGKTAYSDSDGSYTIVGLAAGNHALDATDPVAGAFTFAHPFFQNPITVGPNFTTADFVGIRGTLNLYTPLSAKLASWKYLDNGTDQGTAWTNVAFNETTWSNGVAVLGYGETVNTTIGFGPDSGDKYITYYFRRQFTVTNVDAFTNLLLESLRDDGIVVYLNGREAFRDNMPTGPVNYRTLASSSVEKGNYLQATLPTSYLVTGVNQLAAEVHQGDATSSDVIFDAALSGLSVSNATGLDVVYISSPADNTAVAVSNDVSISVTVFTAATVSQVAFYSDGVNIGTDLDAPYSLVLTNPSPGTHTLTAVASIGSAQVTSPPVNITVAAPVDPAISVSLMETGSPWRYLAGSSAAPATWLTRNFDDSSWSNGLAQLGYGEGDEATVVPGGPTTARWVTHYFRTTFIVPDPAAITDFSARLLRDDGAVVYINGTEVLRDNLPPGTITYSTIATNAVDDGQVFLSFRLDPSVLTVGTNVVAVEVHQSSPTTTDLSFDLGFDATLSTNRSRGVWLAEPIEGSTFALPGNLPLVAQVVAGGSLGVSKVEFYADGSKIGEDTASPFSLTWSNPPAGPHLLQAIATDSASGVITSEVVNIVVSPPPAETALVSFGEQWKYMDDGSNQGTNWAKRFFDDRNWMIGAAKLGYGGDGEVTVVSFGTNANSKYITTYFRKYIMVANPAAYSRLLMRLVRDDGAVVYLNGTEVYRNNMLPSPVSFNSLATIAVDGALETTALSLSLSPSLLVSGSNTIAVEIHQATTNSSDLGFDLELTGLVDTNLIAGVYFTSPPNNARYKTPVNVPLAVEVRSASPVSKVEYFADGTKIGESSANAFPATWNNAPVGVHTLIAIATDEASLQYTSAPVTVIIGQPPPPISPVFQTLVAPGGSWKYWDKSASVDFGWQTRTFDDTGWSNGAARFGWGLDGELTRLRTTNITHYFRRWFNVSNPGQLSALVFELVRDDGVVVYLNGIELFRSNMPGGAVSSSTPAASVVDTPNETTWFETVLATSGSGLLSGSNLLAVELHQAAPNDTDGSFNLGLYGDGTTESRLYIGSPANNRSVPNTFPITIEAQALAASGLTVSNVEFFIDNVKVGQSSTAPYRYLWTNPSLGAHVLRARLTDSSAAVLDSMNINMTVTRELISTTFVPVNSIWKFLDNGSNQGTNWAQLSYNDSSWLSGPARLGYSPNNEDGEVTPVSYGGNASSKYITTYFRRSFVVPAGLVYTNLDCRLVRDDGAVVWLNGRELYRSNMAPPPAVISYTTLASGTVSGADEQTFFATTIATNLPAGTNVIAVEVHQVLANSSDLGFNFEMIASGYVQDIVPPVLSIVMDDNVVELSWPDTGLNWSVYSAPDVSTPGNLWNRISGNHVLVNGRHVFTITPSGGNRFYRLGRP